MIAVSGAWQEAHERALLPETFVEITLDVVDTPGSATVSGANEATFSKSNKIVNNAGAYLSTKHATLEHNLWTLDGSCTIMESPETVPGYVSADDTSGEVVITLGEVSTNTIPGITITWSREHGTFARSFSVVVRNRTTGDGLGQTRYNNDSNVSVIDLEFSEYDCIEIVVYEWSHPDQRIRIDCVKLGHSVVFGKDEIISYTNEQSGSPLGTELSKNEITFELDNADGRWNILNPTGLAKYLYEKQKVTVRYGLRTREGIEWIPAGIFYLTEWKAPSNGITATFVARDAIEFLMGKTYSKPYVQGVAIRDTKGYATKEGVASPDGALAGHIPSGTLVEVYEKVLIPDDSYDDAPDAIGIMVYRSKFGWIDANDLDVTVYEPDLEQSAVGLISTTIPDDVQIEWWGVEGTWEIGTPIPEMVAAEFVQQALATIAQTMWQTGSGYIVIRSPIDALRFGTKAYTISKDISYSHPEVELSKPLKTLNVVYHYRHHTATKTKSFEVNPDGDVITVDIPYVFNDDSHIDYLAGEYIKWWKNRTIVSGEFRADPRLELFDPIHVETKYGTLTPVMITNLKYTYNGAFRATYTGKVIDVDNVVTQEV